MSVFEQWETAMDNMEALMELMHSEWTMVMHLIRKNTNR